MQDAYRKRMVRAEQFAFGFVTLEMTKMGNWKTSAVIARAEGKRC